FTVSKGADLSFSGCVAPGALLKGESFQVKGVVSADEQLNCVTAGVMNSSGTFIPGSYVSVDPQSDRYDLGNTGKAIDFSRLPAGEYTYAVWARTVSGDHMYLFTKKISVSEFSTSNVTAPTTLTQGSSFVLSGSVSSTFNMSRVIVGIKAEGDYWLPGKYVVHTPNSTSYDLASADKYISFGSLPAGTYYYTIYTEDVRGAETKAYSKSFTVGSGSESASGNILSYNASVIRDIGRQPYSGPCGIYAMAYCRAVLDGHFYRGNYSSIHNRIISEYGHGSSMAYWGEAGGSSRYYSSASACYQEVYRQISKGRPCIISFYNNNTGNNHYATVIGYTEGTTAANITFDDLIILDPGYGALKYMKNMNYTSYSSPQLITF
ncbi:MAG: hypothetical protein RR661_07225, partial [Anaerovoracaceae bacterium]